jgi:L-amino acid N-acyltransferase YncA
MEIDFIPLRDEDFETVKEIYDHYILQSTATFHTEKISVSELKEVIFSDHPVYKSYLIDYAGVTCGFCYFTQYKKRQAYDRTSEVTIYLRPEFSGKGTGKIALEFLEKNARENGIKVFIGIITGDNKSSIRLFENAGYEKCAHFKEVGEKFGKILDVVAYQKIL